MPTHRVLFCASEVYPLIKTGGLADVAGSLPHALSKAGHDVRIVLPAYQSVMTSLKHAPRVVLATRVYDLSVRVLQTHLPGTRVPVWLIDCPELFDRPGNPYLADDGEPWPDNALRFAVFNRMIVSLALDQCGQQWEPHIVHCHDWQTGLVPALLESETKRPATVFTIHNLAYQGLFDRTTFEQLQLPEFFWHYERLEFYGQFAFIKGGLVFADRVNTVSPNYAHEIQTKEFGCGMEAVLQARADRLSGIINGIDTQTWNPGSDAYLAHKFNRQRLVDKALNKQALQQSFGLPQDENSLLFGVITRLAEQKGLDMLLALLPSLVKLPIQLALLGSGNKEYETQLQKAAAHWPQQIGVRIGYDEALAHLIEGGADVFIMPSRFEPCGLNQMYSQRYGTLPLVTPVGGLLDSVVDANAANLENQTATGFIMSAVSQAALQHCIERSLELYADKQRWRTMIKTAMAQDFSWGKSAEAYGRLYDQAMRDNPKPVSGN